MTLSRSELLYARIQAESAPSGLMPFCRFMALALYGPEGYYTHLSGFGRQGDFITAPEVSPLFGQCLAQACAPHLQAQAGADVLEFGPGSGALAASLLPELAALDALPQHYYLLEPSPALQALQAVTLRQQLPADLWSRVVWLTQLPSQLRGVILANEVLDALPVELFAVTPQGWQRGQVRSTGASLSLEYAASDAAEFRLGAARLQALQTWPPGYCSEFAPSLAAWISSVAQILTAGAMFICDYGDTWQARFHPSRAQGTLRAFTRQQIAADPLATPGMQDLTADVDFSTVLSAAETAGLTVRAYATQAQFLLAHGLIERLQRHDPQDTVTYLALAQQVKTLVSPEALGERFKVAWLTREAD